MDFKYVKFFVGTVIKLLMFLALCFGAMIISRFAHHPLDKIIPSAAAACFTFIFLAAAEGGKRSFFCKGYILENIIPGALWGLGTAAVPALLGLGLGIFSLHAPSGAIDAGESFYAALSIGLFPGIAIFGYFFHIIQIDFGAVPAVIITSLLYGAYMMTLENGFGWFPPTGFGAISLVCFCAVGIAAGMLILNLGDMRSAAAYLFACELVSALTGELLSGRADSFEVVFAKPAFALICAVTMFSALNKKD